ncbi:MAG: hypothetical protein IT430_06840 [Phycisphaerales bacterium]|nr:hypothetical protein [Phycisphaerales bacterium]
MTDRLDIDAARERLKELESEIGRVRAMLPKEKQPRSAPAMHCPSCGAEMESGILVVKETLWGFLLAGLSYQHLFFRSDDADKDECVLASGVPSHGHRCPACHTVLFRSRS